MNPTGMRIAAALLSLSASAAMAAPVATDEGPPRRDRHGKRMKVEPTEHTTSKTKSTSLKRLLRK